MRDVAQRDDDRDRSTNYEPQTLAWTGLQLPMVLQKPFDPVESAGHVELSPGVQVIVHTVRPAPL